jgi:hypothetical protein
VLFEILLFVCYGYKKKDDTFVLGIPKILHEVEMAFGCWSSLRYRCNGNEPGHHHNSKYYPGTKIKSTKPYPEKKLNE